MKKGGTVETRGGKILEFLRENNQLDLEVPDIAFNVKKSEKTVEAALKKYQLKGLVTARQNEYGRVYWYALPSAPETKVIAPVKKSASRPAGTEGTENREDEADLSDLGVSAIPEAGKSAIAPGPTRPGTSSRGKKTKITPLPKTSAQSGDTSRPGIAGQPQTPPPSGTGQPLRPAIPAQPGAVPVPAPPPETEAAIMEKWEPDKVSDPVTDDFIMKKMKPAIPAALIGIATVTLISLVSLVKSCGSTDQIRALETRIPTDVVKAAELKPVKEESAKIAGLEKKISTLTVEMENLKKELAQLAEASKEAAARKPVPVRKRRR